MNETTSKYLPRPAETSGDVDAVNAVNAKQKFVVLIVLTVCLLLGLIGKVTAEVRQNSLAPAFSISVTDRHVGEN